MSNRFLFLGCLILAILSNPTGVRAAPEVLVLRTRQHVGYDAKRAKQISGLLPRELARQALLIAAREELGMATRDQSLREGMDPADATSLDLLLTVDASTKGQCLLRITQSLEGKEEEIWSQTLKFKSNSQETYSTLIPQLEALSRGEFVEVLKQLGAESPQRKDPIDEIPVPELDAIDLLLSEVDLTAQFLAVRKIEHWIAEHGESAELLGRLSNGYANLGLLTECAWGATSRVLQARSLIYAERLRAKYKNYFLGHWHWAYARAIAGIHFAALEQLTDPLPAGTNIDDLPSLPVWAEVIEPYCRYDTRELGQLAEAGNRWAYYLRMWSYYLAADNRKIDEQAEETVNACPTAFNLYYLMAIKGSLGIKHRASRASLNAMQHACAVDLAERAELPVAAQEAAGKPPTKASPLVGWGSVISTLRAEEDTQEPSWQLFATLLEDTAEIVAVANFRVAKGGSTEHSLAPYAELFFPALEHHPHVSYFLSRKFSKRNEPEKVTEACRDLRFVDSSLWNGYYTTYYVWGTKNSRGENIGYDAYYGASRDFTATSLFVNSERNWLSEKFSKKLFRELKKVSPHSPIALVNEIKSQLTEAEKVKPERIADWEERAGRSASAWHQLGQFYLTRLEYEKSYLCYETSFTLSPRFSTVRAWAGAYEQATDLDKVVPTLQRYLEEEDQGLGHSNTHSEIAKFYLRQDRAEEAKPHALEAAQSWSGNGLSIAAQVCERLELDKEADKWHRELSESYPSYSGQKWYFWRQRSGYKDESKPEENSSDTLEEPRKLAQKHFGPQILEECKSGSWWNLAYYLMEADFVRAQKLMLLRQQQVPGLYSDAMLLAIAHQNGDKQLGEKVLAKIQAGAELVEGEEESWSTRFAKTVTKIFAAETAEEIDYESIDPLIRDESATLKWCNTCYFLSKFFEARGFAEHAARYRDWCITANEPDRITWNLAAFDVRQLQLEANPP